MTNKTRTVSKPLCPSEKTFVFNTVKGVKKEYCILSMADIVDPKIIKFAYFI